MKQNLIIKTLKGTDFSVIYSAYLKAFADYDAPIHTVEQLKQMITRRGFRADLSFGAFDGDQLVSFTLNGIGQWNGQLTAYDTGTGTAKDYRGQGLAKQIFIESIDVLKKAGIAQYLLEVLQHNDKAVNLYKGVGFEISREFDYFFDDKRNLKFEHKPTRSEFRLKKIDVPAPEDIRLFWDFEPSWQNALDSINRTPDHFVSYAIFLEDKMIAYVISEIESGDITQLAVHKDYRRQGIATKLLRHICNITPYHTIKIINTDVKSDAIKKFLKKIGLPHSGKQFEMIKTL